MLVFDTIHRRRSYSPATIVAGAVLATLTGAALVVPDGPGWAASTGSSDNATVELLAEQRTVRPGHPFRVGLRMVMKEDWHTYWMNPGDSGLPIKIDWMLPEGFTAGPIEWPAPARMPTGDEMSYGYSGEVLLPVLITPPRTIGSSAVTIAGDFRWLECADVCVPASAALDLVLPVRPEAPEAGPAAALFAQTRSRMPQDGAGYSLTAEAGPRAISLAFRLPKGTRASDPYFFADQPMVVEYAAPQGLERSRDGYRLTMTPAPNAPEPANRLTGVLVLQTGGPAVRVDVPLAAGDPAPARRPQGVGAGTAAIAAAWVGLAVAAWLWTRRSGSSKRKETPRTGTGDGGRSV